MTTPETDTTTGTTTDRTTGTTAGTTTGTTGRTPETVHPPEDCRLAAARARLAERQEALLAALVAGGPVPPGFDEAQVHAQALGLAHKRRDTAAKVAPDLPRLLGPQYGPLFLAYARRHPQTGGYRADARAFAAWALANTSAYGPGEGLGPERRRALARWLDGPAPEQPTGPLTRLRRALTPRRRPTH